MKVQVRRSRRSKPCIRQSYKILGQVTQKLCGHYLLWKKKDGDNSGDFDEVLVVPQKEFLNEPMILIKQKKGTANLLIPRGFDTYSITMIRVIKNNANTVSDFISTNKVCLI